MNTYFRMTSKILTFFVLILFLTCPSKSAAHPDQMPAEYDQAGGGAGGSDNAANNTSTTIRPTRTLSEIYLSYSVLVFGAFIFSIEAAIMWRKNVTWGPNSIKIFGLTITVVFGAFLTTAGYSQTQIAPMIGILGTLLGYLLGNNSEKQ